MTVPVGDDRPPITAPGIHDKPAEKPKAPFTQRQLKAIGDALVNQILARVLLAVAGIEVPLLGKPFAFLAAWAQELQQRANDAYANAAGAQSSANYANAQLMMLAGSGLATEVAGGVAINEFFDEAAANTLTNFTRTSDGSGGGHFGSDGTGKAVWKKSGGQARTHWDRHNTALATRYQVVAVLLAAPVQQAFNGTAAYTYLRARINAANDTFVYLRIGYTGYADNLRVGCYVGGSETVFDTSTVAIPWAAGDVVHFIVGTDDDDREFVVKRNGQTIWRNEDVADVSQVDSMNYLYAGMASRAADRGTQFFTNNSQTVPAELDIWAAADRLPASV